MDIISRSEWGAKAPTKTGKMKTELDRIFGHWMGPAFPSQMSDIQIMKSVQGYHMETKGWSDIAYSWTIGRETNPDGTAKVYEGRGMNVSGAHTFTENDDSYGIAWLIGEGETATHAMLEAFTHLVEHIRTNHNTEPLDMQDITVMGHRHDKQVDGKGTATNCPGAEQAAWLWDYNHARDYKPAVVISSSPEEANGPEQDPPSASEADALERLALLEIEVGVLSAALDRVLNVEGVRAVFYEELQRLAAG